MNGNRHRIITGSLKNGRIPRNVKTIPKGRSIGISVPSNDRPSVNQVHHAANVTAGTEAIIGDNRASNRRLRKTRTNNNATAPYTGAIATNSGDSILSISILNITRQPFAKPWQLHSPAARGRGYKNSRRSMTRRMATGRRNERGARCGDCRTPRPVIPAGWFAPEVTPCPRPSSLCPRPGAIPRSARRRRRRRKPDPPGSRPA
jgi:hypothetical protein